MKETIEIVRHTLASIDLSDVRELEEARLSENEFNQRAGDSLIFYNSHFEKVIKLLIQEQLKFLASNAADDRTLAFAQGTINGLGLVNDWFMDQVKAFRAREDEQEKPRPGESFPPVGKI